MEPGFRPIPNRLKMHRRQMRFSQRHVAKLLDLSNTAPLSRWEQGIQLPNTLNLLKLSILYRTFPNELYFEYIQELRKSLQTAEWNLHTDN